MAGITTAPRGGAAGRVGATEGRGRPALRVVEGGGAADRQGPEVPGARGLRGLRLTVRGRVVVVALALLLAGGVGGAARSAWADGASGGLVVQRHVVEPGETLWAIADRVAAEEDDVRDVVLELMRLNRLPSGDLLAGQTIVVPAR